MLCCICSLVFKQNLVHTLPIIINVTGINVAVTSNEKAYAVLPLLPKPMLSIIQSSLFIQVFFSFIHVTGMVETEKQMANKNSAVFILFFIS